MMSETYAFGARVFLKPMFGTCVLYDVRLSIKLWFVDTADLAHLTVWILWSDENKLVLLIWNKPAVCCVRAYACSDARMQSAGMGVDQGLSSDRRYQSNLKKRRGRLPGPMHCRPAVYRRRRRLRTRPSTVLAALQYGWLHRFEPLRSRQN